MGKGKVHSGASKRFKVSAGGKIIHKKTGRRHLLRKRSKTAKRHLRIDAVVKHCDRNRIKQLLIL